MPPAYVKPYVKRRKNDATDAEAICEAVTRPNMRFVATKTPEQQSCLTLHRTRHLFIRQQTSVINAIRAAIDPKTTSPSCRHTPPAMIKNLGIFGRATALRAQATSCKISARRSGISSITSWPQGTS